MSHWGRVYHHITSEDVQNDTLEEWRSRFAKSKDETPSRTLAVIKNGAMSESEQPPTSLNKFHAEFTLKLRNVLLKREDITMLQQLIDKRGFGDWVFIAEGDVEIARISDSSQSNKYGDSDWDVEFGEDFLLFSYEQWNVW